MSDPVLWIGWYAVTFLLLVAAIASGSVEGIQVTGAAHALAWLGTVVALVRA